MDVYNEDDALEEELLLFLAMAYMVRARGKRPLQGHVMSDRVGPV